MHLTGKVKPLAAPHDFKGVFKGRKVLRLKLDSG